MTWEIKIERISNGFILNWKDDYSEDNILTVKEAYQDTNENLNGHRESLIMALNSIVDYFGLAYQKHYVANDKFIKIKLVGGDDYFDDDKEGYEFIYPVLTREDIAKLENKGKKCT